MRLDIHQSFVHIYTLEIRLSAALHVHSSPLSGLCLEAAAEYQVVPELGFRWPVPMTCSGPATVAPMRAGRCFHAMAPGLRAATGSKHSR